MLNFNKQFLTAMLIVASMTMSSCEKDVYEAPSTNDINVVAVTEAHGSAQNGWTVNGIAQGVYDLEFYTKSSSTSVQPYVKAGDRMTAIVPSSGSWTKGVVKGIVVGENGQCNISLVSQGANVEISNISLVSSQQEVRPLLKGGDVTMLTYVEDNGGAYYNANGEKQDCMSILAENGMNLVRLRVYNDPGNSSFSPSDKMPAGYQNTEDALRLAKRAKEKGMQILLTLHYSDYWTNGTDQNKPHDWAELSFDQLTTAIHDFTADVVGKMVAQGTSPEYVALGNEIQAGILYPDGACTDMIKFSTLLNSAAKAVREAAPDAKIVLHSDAAGDLTKYKWFFGEMRNFNVDYDIIGASYYPYWTDKNASTIRSWADQIIDMFNKDIILMETAYAWNATLPDGFAGQIEHNGPYAEYSKNGQRNFIADLSNQIKQVKSGRVLGYIYWDPIFIEVPGLGWIVGGKNLVSNTTLFGFDGEWLPVFDAMKYNN